MKKSLKILVFTLILPILLISCKGPDGKFKLPGSDARKFPADPKKRVEQNIKEGRGVSIGSQKGRSGSFDFATSNEMWRGTIEILDFVPLATADYGGGVIITDWYKDDLDSNESIKIMVNFLSNEIRADGLEVKIYKKVCKSETNCNTQLMSSNLEQEIKLAILKKAAQIKTKDRKKRAEDSDYEPIKD